jgi:hypothetical protein
MTKEESRLAESRAPAKSTGSAGDPILASAHGAQYGKITVLTAPHGNISRTSMPVRVLIVGTKVDWQESVIAGS